MTEASTALTVRQPTSTALTKVPPSALDARERLDDSGLSTESQTGGKAASWYRRPSLFGSVSMLGHPFSSMPLPRLSSSCACSHPRSSIFQSLFDDPFPLGGFRPRWGGNTLRDTLMPLSVFSWFTDPFSGDWFSPLSRLFGRDCWPNSRLVSPEEFMGAQPKIEVKSDGGFTTLLKTIQPMTMRTGDGTTSFCGSEMIRTNDPRLLRSKGEADTLGAKPALTDTDPETKDGTATNPSLMERATSAVSKMLGWNKDEPTAASTTVPETRPSRLLEYPAKKEQTSGDTKMVGWEDESLEATPETTQASNATLGTVTNPETRLSRLLEWKPSEGDTSATGEA